MTEVNLTKEFRLQDGDEFDWSVAGPDLDCKFSEDVGNWEIPMEMYLCPDHGTRSGEPNQAAILVWLSDDSSEWAVGVVRITDEKLRWTQDKVTGDSRRTYNRDNKRRLSPAGEESIYWLWGGTQNGLQENTLLRMEDSLREGILREGLSGQGRVNELFRKNSGSIVRRPVLLTVAQQDDAPRRARDARIGLSPDGILVLGHQGAHPDIAVALGVPVPEKGEWVSVRLRAVAWEEVGLKVWFDGSFWTINTDDRPNGPAPQVPRYRLQEVPAT